MHRSNIDQSFKGKAMIAAGKIAANSDLKRCFVACENNSANVALLRHAIYPTHPHCRAI